MNLTAISSSPLAPAAHVYLDSYADNRYYTASDKEPREDPIRSGGGKCRRAEHIHKRRIQHVINSLLRPWPNLIFRNFRTQALRAVPDGAVAFVAHLGGRTHYPKPHRKPQAEGYNHQHKLSEVVDRFVMITNVFFALVAMNGFKFCHESSPTTRRL